MSLDEKALWADGQTDDHGYDRYDDCRLDGDPNIEVLISIDWAGSYEFDMIQVWRRKSDGALVTAYDCGCSCPTPFSGLTWDGAKKIESIDNMREFYSDMFPNRNYDRYYDEPNGPDIRWDGNTPQVAELKKRVTEALAEGVDYKLPEDDAQSEWWKD